MIFIAESVVEEVAREISDITGDTVEKLESGTTAESEDTDKSDISELEEKLKKAIEEENYELAAILRDKLQELGAGDG